MKILKASEIQESNKSMLIYGNPGIGKTTLLGMLPGKTLIVDVDQGTNVLRGKTNVDIVRLSEDLHELLPLVQELQSKCEYDNVCIDSLSEMERGLLSFYGRMGKNDGIPDLSSYQRVDFKLMRICRQFRTLPCWTVFTTWESQKDIIAPTGEKYTQVRPMLRDKNTDNICGLCDIVGHLEVDAQTGERYVQLESSPRVIAKDRLNKRTSCKFEELIQVGE